MNVRRAWMAQWREAGPALAEQRANELRSMTEIEAREAIVSLLDLGARTPLDPRRVATSGLVTQQALFHRRRPVR